MDRLPDIEELGDDQRLRLLELLLNDLHRRGMVSSDTLVQIASDLILLDYREDQDLLCFDEVAHEMEEE